MSHSPARPSKSTKLQPISFPTMRHSSPSSHSPISTTTSSHPHSLLRNRTQATSSTSSSSQQQQQPQRPRLDPNHLYPSFDAFRTIARAYAAFYNFQPKLSLRDQQRVLFRCKGVCDSDADSDQRRRFPNMRQSPYPLDHESGASCSFSVGVRKYKKKGDMVAIIAKNAMLRHSCGVRGELEMDDESDGMADRTLWRGKSGESGMVTPADANGSERDRSGDHSMDRDTMGDGVYSESLMEQVMMELARDDNGTLPSSTGSGHNTRFAPFPAPPNSSQRQARLTKQALNQPTSDRGTSPDIPLDMVNTASTDKLPAMDPVLEPELRTIKNKISATMYEVAVLLIANGFPTEQWELVDLEIRMAEKADQAIQTALNDILDHYLLERTKILPSEPPYLTTRPDTPAPALVSFTVDEKLQKLKVMRNVVRSGWNELLRRTDLIANDWRNVSWANTNNSSAADEGAQAAYLDERRALWQRRLDEVQLVTARIKKLVRAVKGFGQYSTRREVGQRAKSVG